MIRPLYGHLWILAAILFLTQGGQAISAICIVLVPTDSLPQRLAGSAIGFTTLFGGMFGGFAAPIVAGALAARHGLTVPLWIAAGGALLVFLMALALKPYPPSASGGADPEPSAAR
jgi:MFS family permease